MLIEIIFYWLASVCGVVTGQGALCEEPNVDHHRTPPT